MYRERQALPVSVTGAVSLVGALVVGWLWYDLAVIHGPQSTNLPGALIATVILLLAVASALALQLRTDVADGTVTVSLWPLGRLSILAGDVEEVGTLRYSPMGDFGGWGIRPGLDGQIYSLRGDQAVRVRLRSGRVIYIGTADPDALARAIGQARS